MAIELCGIRCSIFIIATQIQMDIEKSSTIKYANPPIEVLKSHGPPLAPDLFQKRGRSRIFALVGSDQTISFHYIPISTAVKSFRALLVVDALRGDRTELRLALPAGVLLALLTTLLLALLLVFWSPRAMLVPGVEVLP